MLAAALALGMAACGGEDFENDPRPPVSAEISIQVSADDVNVSPTEFGAGIANFTVANLGPEPTIIEINGPSEGETEEIGPGDTAELRLELASGDYQAIASGLDADPFAFTVGPERESGSNDLLLP